MFLVGISVLTQMMMGHGNAGGCIPIANCTMMSECLTHNSIGKFCKILLSKGSKFSLLFLEDLRSFQFLGWIADPFNMGLESTPGCEVSFTQFTSGYTSWCMCSKTKKCATVLIECHAYVFDVLSNHSAWKRKHHKWCRYRQQPDSKLNQRY